MSDISNSDPEDVDGWDDAEPSREEETTGPETLDRHERTGIAWWFVAVLVMAILLAVFIVQNNEPMAVEFLWFDFEMSIWIVVLAVVLITLVVDQIVSLIYRRRKRQTLVSGSRAD